MAKIGIALFSAIFLIFQFVRAENLDRTSAFSAEFEKIALLQQKIQKNSVREKELLRTIFQLNQEIFRLNEEANTQSLQMSALQDETKLVADRILLLSDELQAAKSSLRQSAAYLRFISGHPSQKIFWQSQPPYWRARHMFLVRQFSQHQIERVRQLQNDFQELELRKSQFINQREILSKAESSLQEKKRKVDQKRRVQIAKQASLRADSQKLIQEINQIRARLEVVGIQSAELQKLSADKLSLSKFIPERFFERKARLSWPTVGQIEKPFGPHRVAPNVHLMQKGVWIRPDTSNSEVRAVFTGRVAALRYVEGFGLTLVVDHQDDYFSVYGGLKKVLVQTGSQVAEGDLLARAEDRVYFEIRHFTEPYNPKEWLKLAMQKTIN